MSEPDLYAYLDYRAFLRDWFEARHRADPRFSRRHFARLLGKSTPGLLGDIVSGKRHLNPQTCGAYARAMCLSAAESDFFSALVALASADDASGRNKAWQRIAAARGFREARSIEAAGFEYLSHWYYSAIRELALRPGWQDDPAWIARSLRPTVGVRQVKKALRTLRELGLLIETDGRLGPSQGIITTPHEVADLSAHNYHQQMLGLAAEATERFTQEERHFVAATIAVPSHLIPTLKRELDALQERLLHLSDTAEDPPDEVIQVNLHFFPLSDRPEEV